MTGVNLITTGHTSEYMTDVKAKHSSDLVVVTTLSERAIIVVEGRPWAVLIHPNNRSVYYRWKLVSFWPPGVSVVV